MDVIALTRLTSAPERLIEDLAEILGCTLYDARLRRPRDAPCVLELLSDRAQAARVAQRLRRLGYAIDHIEAAAVERDEARVMVHRFELTAEALRVWPLEGVGVELAFTDIALMLRAQVEVRRTTTTLVESRPASMAEGRLGRADTSLERQLHMTVREEGALHIYGASGAPLVVRASRALFDGLGARMTPSRRANFQALCEVLRERAPSARYDDRLVHAQGRRAMVPFKPDAPLDVAITTLARALRGAPGERRAAPPRALTPVPAATPPEPAPVAPAPRARIGQILASFSHEPAPTTGRLESMGLEVRWRATTIEIRSAGHPTVTLDEGSLAAVQVSRWQRRRTVTRSRLQALLRRSPEVIVEHLVNVELRGRRGFRARVSAVVEEADLEGLARMNQVGVRVAWRELESLLQQARVLGARVLT